MRACRVWRYRDAQPPAPVVSQPAQQQPQHQALEAHRRDIADLLRQAPFAATQLRCSNEEDKVAAHQP